MVAIQLVCNPYFLRALFFHQFHAGLSADPPTHLQENGVMYLTKKTNNLVQCNLSNQEHLDQWISSLVPEGTIQRSYKSAGGGHQKPSLNLAIW